ncbi:MAG TPA: response regulator, partial [Actinomycetes bacterium]|nr:response regulator [Actinomycetes bacterium]
MSSWANDPELVATFRQEVEDRLASLCDGLLELEQHPQPRQVVSALFRDAHTVKGSARMLGLDDVVEVAHRSEDLLGAIRDGRFEPRKDLVDLLLTAAEGIRRGLPGAEKPVAPDDLGLLNAALDSALDGTDPVAIPRLTVVATPEEADVVESNRPRSGESVRVPVRRVHGLLDVVGEAELEVRRVERFIHELSELSTEQVRLSRKLRHSAASDESLAADVSDNLHALGALGDQFQASLRELRGTMEDAQNRLARVRDGAMGLAMVPVRRVAAAFPQLVREVATATSKDASLQLIGEDVELDTRVLDGVADALRHLVTNAVDHGCETTAERIAAGKRGQATVTVSARAAGSTIVIEVGDDGHGIDEERLRTVAIERGLLPADSEVTGQPLLSLLFKPGFSTRDEVTSTSGRGVGLDVVRTAVEELGGTVEIESELGIGTRFVMTLPVTLGVMRCLVARLGEELYAVPVTNVVETISVTDADMTTVAGARVLVRHGATVPIADLGRVLGVPGDRETRVGVVVRYGGVSEQLAWTVDALEGELEVVVKDLGGFLGRLPYIGGGTIDSDGSVMLLLDVRELALEQFARGATLDLPGQAPVLPVDPQSDAPQQPTTTKPGNRKARVLVVEDSIGVRELQRVILEGAGYDVTTAVDGSDGAARLSGDPVDLVLSDVEMPGMDGFTLTRAIRRTRGWESVPVVIMTSRGDEADKRAGLDAGANAYLLKSEFDQSQLVDTVLRL